jgi:hypothetical protein
MPFNSESELNITRPSSNNPAVSLRTKIRPIPHPYKNLLNRLFFYGLKLPGVYLLMITGILVDFTIQFPIMMICAVENLFRKRSQRLKGTLTDRKRLSRDEPKNYRQAQGRQNN